MTTVTPMFRFSIVRTCALFALALAATQAHSATIALRTSTTGLVLGEQVALTIYGTGFADGADGGDMFIGWTPNLAFVSLLIDDPPWDLSSVDVADAPLSPAIVDVFSFVTTPGVGGVEFTIGTLTLEAVGSGDGRVAVSGSRVGWSLAGETISGVAFAGEIQPIQIAELPVPATGWMLAVAFALLGRTRVGRHRARSPALL